MFIQLETETQEELNKFRDLAIQFMNGSDDPLGCEPACRQPENTCEQCIEEYADWLTERIKNKRKLNVGGGLWI